MTHPLTADLCATAVVTAARAYGDHPICVLEAKRGLPRRSLASAARALSDRTGATAEAVCKVLGLSWATYQVAARKETGAYLKAVWSADHALQPLLDQVPAPAAPSPVVVEAAPAAYDHRPMIAAALARRAHVAPRVVDGVRPITTEGCLWPLGDPAEPDFHRCGAEAVAGRNYCAGHCKAAGQKPTPKSTPVVGRVVRSYSSRDEY